MRRATYTDPPRCTDRDTSESLTAIERTFGRDPLDPTVAVLDGYGIRVRVERGHLELTDGLGPHRRTRRYSRAVRTLRRLVIMGDGSLTYQALRWCRATGVSVALLDDDGVSLASSTPGLDDARLRRAQAAAMGTETGLEIVRGLLRAKLTGQAQIARHRLDSAEIADAMGSWCQALDAAGDLEEIRAVEAQAAQAYFSGWPKDDCLRFVSRDAKRVPAHWRSFDGRRSTIRGRGMSNQRAERPLNSILNFCFRLAEIEAHLAAVAVGLDPGLGLLHSDHPNRDSLVLDLLEVLRPEVEDYVLRLVSEHVFRKSDFAELPDGHVRLLAPLSHELAEAIMPLCAKAVAPHAEAVTHALLELVPGRTVKRTPLTSTRRRQAVRRVRSEERTVTKAPLPKKACRECGAIVERLDYQLCPDCRPAVKLEAAVKAGEASQAARRNRKAAGLPEPSTTTEARARIGAAIGARDEEALAWEASHPEVLANPEDFAPIAAGLQRVTLGQIMAQTGLSKSYASSVRRGENVPHLRHWPALAGLAGVPLPFTIIREPSPLDVAWWKGCVLPVLRNVPTTAISSATGLSSGQASKVRRGLCVPHPRHWEVLAGLAGVEYPAAHEREGQPQ